MAVDDSYSTNEDTTLTWRRQACWPTTPTSDGDTLTAVLVTGASHGTLTLNARRLVHLHARPPTTTARTASPTRPTTAAANSNTATVTITVNSVNDRAGGGQRQLQRQRGHDADVTAPGVLANDTDVDGDPLTAVLVAGPAHGTLTLNANGSFTYAPTANYNGAGQLHLQGQRRHGRHRNMATVTLTVNAGERRAGGRRTTATRGNEDATLTVQPRQACWPTTPTSTATR